MIDEDSEVKKVQQNRPLAHKNMRQIGRIDLPQVTGLQAKLCQISYFPSYAVCECCLSPYPSDEFGLLELAINQYSIAVLVDFGAP